MSFSIDHVDFSKDGGLIPVVVQDATTRHVLMVAFQNREALQKTMDEGRATFFSRSRNELWTKGETSGNYLHVREILLDCDQDTILILADPTGPICHTGSDSCFGTKNVATDLAFLDQLTSVIESRKRANDPSSSYTASLLDSGIGRVAQKVGEEAVEVVIAACRDERENLIDEASDLVYHLMVLLAAKNLSLVEIVNRLKDRHRI